MPLRLPLNIESVAAFAGAPAMGQIRSASTVSASSSALLAVASSSEPRSVFLMEAFDWDSSNARVDMLTRIEPFPDTLEGSLTQVCALHLCTIGNCGSTSLADSDAGESWLWAASDAGHLAAVGLVSGSVVAVKSPWSATGPRIRALAGNATHLIAVATAEAGGNRTLHVARYAALLE